MPVGFHGGGIRCFLDCGGMTPLSFGAA